MLGPIPFMLRPRTNGVTTISIHRVSMLSLGLGTDSLRNESIKWGLVQGFKCLSEHRREDSGNLAIVYKRFIGEGGLTATNGSIFRTYPTKSSASQAFALPS